MTLTEKENYFSTIQKQLEEKNVVTFKWLSRTCKIHSSIAKQLLNDFISNSGENEYCITYLVFGRSSNGNLVINLSDENQLKNEDITVIDKQIYSIERSSSPVGTDELYNDDKLTFQLEQMNLSSINYPFKINKKASVSRYPIQSTSDKKSSDENSSEKPSCSAVKAELKKERVNKLNFTSLPKSKTEETSVNKTESVGETCLLYKSPIKASGTAKNDSKVNKSKASNNSSTGKGSLSVLFLNHRVKNTSASKNNSSNEDKSSEIEAEKMDSQKAEKSKEKSSDENQPAKKSNSVDVNKTQKSVKRNSTKSKKKPDKKRKRITKAFYSSSDESASDAEASEKESRFDELEEEPEPQPETEKPIESVPDTVTTSLGKRRKRKVISKNGMDDDGFFYTIKEVVYESCESDDNDENDPNVNLESNKRFKTEETNDTNAASKTKVVPPSSGKSSTNQIKAKTSQNKAKTKQASIMNFFKKS